MLKQGCFSTEWSGSGKRLPAVNAPEGVLQNVVGHLNARRLTVVARTSKMDAGKDPGFLHFIEEWGREPLSLEFRIDGHIWMAPGSGRVRKGDVVGVIMQEYQAA